MLINKVTKSRKSKKGFTLLEVIISFALISIILIPIANLVLTSVKINKSTENKQQAKAVLQETIENIKAIDNFSSALSKPLNNGITLSEATGEDNKLIYSLSGEINGFSIEGSIKEKSQVVNNKVSEMEVDRTIYFNKGSISISNGKEVIGEAIKKLSDNLATPSEEVFIEMKEAGEINVTYGGSIIAIPKPEAKSLLICVNEDSEKKLNLSVENKSHTENLKIYLFNGEKVSERQDVIISKFNGQIELIEGVQHSEDIINEKLYFVELRANKNGEVVENMNLELLK
ncbi:MAG: type II secretion system protein [Clostridium sulfidigenes]|uniref:Type II secretion system protein n=1 Tax=Clostridium sulfidigenes TaxID=318464 RepID=A0A927ZJA2_9CLOT|nr:type II secretion system protein [Clostridium sulfidigenes]